MFALQELSWSNQYARHSRLCHIAGCCHTSNL